MEVFKPKDIYPCTTDTENWHEDISIKALFGHLCSGSDFVHDREMMSLEDERVAAARRKRKREEVTMEDSQETSQRSNRSESDAQVTLVDIEHAQSQDGQPGTSNNKSEVPTTKQLLQSPASNVQVQATLNDHEQSIHPKSEQLSVVKKAYAGQLDRHDEEPPSLQARTDESNSKMYRCAWLDCSENFSTLGTLRSHVVGRHLVKVKVKREDAYGCLWNLCPNPKILYFSSEEMWEAHMDEVHYLEAMQKVLSQMNEGEAGNMNDDSQHSLPTPSDANQGDDRTDIPKEPVQSNTGTQTAPIELSDRNSEPEETDEDCSDDISLNDIDRKLRKRVSTIAADLDSSLIMARTLLLAKGFQPLREFYIMQIDSADHRTKYEPAFAEEDYEEFSDKIDRLRELLPTADELVCLDALRKHRGNFRQARDKVAASEQHRIENESDLDDDTDATDDQDSSSNPSSDDDDENHAKKQRPSQLSLSTSAFNTPASTSTSNPTLRPPPPSSKTRIQTRKEAYKAARGLGGREWGIYSPLSAGNSHTEPEVEL